MLDENFLRRVYKMTLLLWLLSIGLCLLGGMWRVVLGLTLGVFLSLILLYSLEWIVKRAFVANNHRPRSSLIKLTLLKYPLIIVSLYFLVRWEAVNLLAFCLGISMPYLVIFLKALGTILVKRSQKTDVKCQMSDDGCKMSDFCPLSSGANVERRVDLLGGV